MKKLSVCSGDGRANGKTVGRYVGAASSRMDFESPFKSLDIDSDEIGSAMMWTSARDHSKRVPTGPTFGVGLLVQLISSTTINSTQFPSLWIQV